MDHAHVYMYAINPSNKLKLATPILTGHVHTQLICMHVAYNTEKPCVSSSVKKYM